MAYTSSILQTETYDYISNIIAVGGGIDAATIHYLDKFIVTCKRDGTWTKLKHIMPFMGKDLASSLVALKYTTAGTFSAAKIGTWAESNYTTALGIDPGVSNSTRALTLGFNSSGLSYNDMSFGVALTQPDEENYGNPLILFNAATTDKIRAGRDAVTVNGVNITSWTPKTNLQLSSFTASGMYLNIDGCDIATQSLPSSWTVSGEWRMFFRGDTGATYFGRDHVGFVFIGTGLTNAEVRLLYAAIDELLTNTGRLRSVKKPRAIIFGDSIGDGVGATTPASTGWANTFCKKNGYILVNVSVSANIFTTSQTPQALGYDKVINSATLQKDTAILSMGVNDMQVRDVTTNGDSAITADFQTKLEAAILSLQAAGAKVIVGSVSFTSASNDTKRLAYATVAATAAKNKGVMFADLNNYMNDKGGAALLTDTTHPTQAGHDVIAEQFQNALRGVLVRQPTLDFGSISSLASAYLTVTVFNVVVGMSVSVGLPAAIEAGIIVDAFVSANDTVTVRATNITLLPINPASGVYKITVFTNY